MNPPIKANDIIKYQYSIIIYMKDSKRGKDGQRRTIWYSSGRSSFGIILVTFTERGICGVSTLAPADSIPEYLKKEYPDKNVEKGEISDQYIDGIIKTLDGSKGNFNIDVEGTDFQKKVWGAISSIPYGSTATYSQIAEQIGRPSAVRAVANACGKNPVPLIIPCHRVIRKNGGLGGYGLGIDRKKRLLEHEKSFKEMQEGNQRSS